MFEVGKFLLQVFLILNSVFLILLILVQRGRGGGITGALGGMGGQSAFGSKAGDVFTRITVVAAAVWILACMLMISIYNRPIPPDRTVQSSFTDDTPRENLSTDDEDTEGAPAVAPGDVTPPPSEQTGNETDDSANTGANQAGGNESDSAGQNTDENE